MQCQCIESDKLSSWRLLNSEDRQTYRERERAQESNKKEEEEEEEIYYNEAVDDSSSDCIVKFSDTRHEWIQASSTS